MRHIKVTFADGNVIHTGINGTDQEIIDYYLKAEGFELYEGKPLVKAVRVEIPRDEEQDKADQKYYTQMRE